MNVKREVMALIEELPEETTLDEIEYHLYVRKKLDRADEAIRNGRYRAITPGRDERF